MKILELKPLLDNIDIIKNNSDAQDVYEYVFQGVNKAVTPSMAQSVCEYIDSMCHPRAWGDRHVCGFDDITEWIAYLSTLANTAQNCWNQISKNYGSTN